MLERRPIFPNVIEVNHQLRHVVGCNVYLVYDADEWILIDIGYEDAVEEIVELIRQLDFPFAQCKLLVATHSDVDHVQGMAKLKRILRAPLAAHPSAVPILAAGDPVRTFARIEAQDVHLSMPPVRVDRRLKEGDVIAVGRRQLEVWWTPGHTENHLAFRMGDLLFSGDTIFRDGCVGAIDAHHGSDLPEYLRSLERLRAADAAWLLPSHGPVFRKDPELLDRAIRRLTEYQHMADFGTCALDWPLLDQWEEELAAGDFPGAGGQG